MASFQTSQRAQGGWPWQNQWKRQRLVGSVLQRPPWPGTFSNAAARVMSSIHEDTDKQIPAIGPYMAMADLNKETPLVHRANV